MDNSVNCDRCGKLYNEFLGDRFWSGEFSEGESVYETLCDSCHRIVVRS
jgi:hypothetical protein